MVPPFSRDVQAAAAAGSATWWAAPSKVVHASRNIAHALKNQKDRTQLRTQVRSRPGLRYKCVKSCKAPACLNYMHLRTICIHLSASHSDVCSSHSRKCDVVKGTIQTQHTNGHAVYKCWIKWLRLRT
jgi:hypothetical protein